MNISWLPLRRHICRTFTLAPIWISVAQWLERLTGHQKIAASIPVWSSEIVFLRLGLDERSLRSSKTSPGSHIYNIYHCKLTSDFFSCWTYSDSTNSYTLAKRNCRMLQLSSTYIETSQASQNLSRHLVDLCIFRGRKHGVMPRPYVLRCSKNLGIFWIDTLIISS